MLCYVMLCYVMLCYVMLCYVMLCYVMLCYVMLCCVMLCYVVLCCVVLCVTSKEEWFIGGTHSSALSRRASGLDEWYDGGQRSVAQRTLRYEAVRTLQAVDQDSFIRESLAHIPQHGICLGFVRGNEDNEDAKLSSRFVPKVDSAQVIENIWGIEPGVGRKQKDCFACVALIESKRQVLCQRFGLQQIFCWLGVRIIICDEAHGHRLGFCGGLCPRKPALRCNRSLRRSPSLRIRAWGVVRAWGGARAWVVTPAITGPGGSFLKRPTFLLRQ